ncbi:MAG: alpha-amylase [Puia sp.]|nr:alpha-amylase [Puia sp.]
MTNGTMIQFFHWYYPADGSLWKHVQEKAEELASLGVNAVWLPPACKGMGGGSGSGYDLYDLYDLGEFDQKGAVRTKFGTREEYLDAIKTLHDRKIQVYADVVLNHRGGADEKERIRVRRVDPENRKEFTSEPFEIDAFTKFTFPGRNGKYSRFIWDFRCFSGIDYADDLKESGIFKILNEYGETWEDLIDDEKGNFDYLMFADIDFRNPAVREECKKWGEWYLKETGVDGFRMDAIKHIPPGFVSEWVDHMKSIKPDLFVVSEYWAPGRLDLLLRTIDVTGGKTSLFDSSLHHNFFEASNKGKDYDLSAILSNSLVQANPSVAVTVIDNHDTQPLESLEAPVEAWFKPLAYALILLREGGYPCVFYPDLYGAHYRGKGKDGSDQEIFLDKCENLDKLLAARDRFVYGQQRDYFDHPNCVGWTLEGGEDRAGSGCAVLLSNGEEGFKDMEIGKRHAGKVFRDYLQRHPAEVTVNAEGWGTFHVSPGSVSVWVHGL